MSHVRSFTTTVYTREGPKEVICYYRKPTFGEWFTDFGVPGKTEYVDEDGNLTKRGLGHINSCTYGYAPYYYNDGSCGWKQWHEDTYDKNRTYVTIIPVEGYEEAKKFALEHR